MLLNAIVFKNMINLVLERMPVLLVTEDNKAKQCLLIKMVHLILWMFLFSL